MASIRAGISRPGDDIDRLALRISLADIDEQFEKILQKSLVFILKYLSKYEDHRKKLMELLGDITRRLRCRPNIQVPVYELFLSYNDPSNSVFLVNFSHMYIRLGFPRLPIQQKIKLIPVLFASLSDEKPVYQRDGLLHLVLPVIDSLTNDLSPHDLCFNELLYQRRYISDFFSLVLLLPYKSDRSDAVIPDGYSSYDLGRMLHDQFSYITSAEELEKFKVSIMTFYTRRFFPVEESIIPILFGYGDSRHSVVSVAAKELRTLSILVDWEDESLLTQILAWYLGRRRDFDPKGRNEPRRPLSPNMRIKLGHYLMRSRITFPGPLASSLVEAAVLALEPSSVAQSNIFPNSGQRHPPNCNYTSIENGPISDADSGTYPQTPSRTQTEETICANSPANTPGSCSASFTQQRRLAEHGLDLLSHLINNMTTLNGSASLAALRCLINFVYERTTDELTYVRARGFEILSRYLARDPNHLLKDPTQLPRLFDVLSEDNPVEVKLAAAHCLRRLAVTLHNAQKQNYLAIRGQLVKLERLLYENIEKPDPLSRLVAVNFAGLIYPSDHIPTRYLILQALGDIDPRVRAEACVAFEQFLDPNIIHDIVYGRIKLPSFVEFVNHDTQHSRKNPFVEVERLIPVVQFIRLCLLATRGGLTPAQEAGLNYETEEEVRFLINQTVRYFLSAGNSTTVSQASLAINNTSATVSTNSTTNPVSACSNVPVINPEQAKRSIDTYFRLIQVVIFTRSQHTKDSPDFPNYLEEVLVGNTKELITCNKQLFDRMNNVLLATPRGASCRHACASVYSVVVMETESPAQALQTAKGMLAALPSCNAVIDEESSHAVQGMFMGAAYLLERLFTAYVVPFRFSDSFLVKPSQLVDSSKINNTKATVNDVGVCYVNSSVSQATVVSLLEALVVIGRAGCLSHLSPGTLPIAGNSTISLMNSKATFVHRIMSYLPTVTEEHSSSLLRYPRVAQAALRTLAAVCMGEGYQTIKDEVSNSSGSKPADNSEPRRHPHTISIMKIMVGTAEINDPSLHLSVGTALADCILGPLSPYKFHWYERNYPLVIPRDSLIAAVTGPNVRWLAGHLRSLLVRLPGQVQTRPATIAATLWILNLVRRLGPLPKSLLSYQLLIDLLDEKDESLQCVAVATLGLIYDKSSEEERSELISSLTQAIGDDKRSFSPVYHELFTLAHQIGRSDLALSLIVLAIALPSTRQTIASSNPQPGSNFSNIAYNLASSVTYSSLVRRLGRSLAPALPRLVPRVFVRRFDFARPKLRQAMENVWLGLVLYATNSTIPFLSSNTSYANLSVGVSSSSSILISPTNQNTQLSSSPTPNSIHSLASEMVEAHFNAIVCEIKTQLGFNTLNFHATHIGSNSPQSTSNVSNVSGTLSTNRVTSNTVSQVNGTVTQNIRLRDACCLAISSLATHPSADKRLAGHLPALLSGLLSLCDECESSDILENDNAGITTPAEEAAITVQKLVIRVLENPCSREAANGLLPGLLPVVIERAPWSLTSQTSNKNGRQPPGELQRLALELLLAAARTARPSALRPALPQLVLSGLRAMSSIHPSVVANLMRQPIHHLHIYSHASPNSSNLTSTSLSVPSVSLPVGVSQSISPTHQPSLSPLNSVSAYKEVQMAEVLRLCVRLLDDICLSRLIVPFTELIKAGGSSSSVSIDGNCSVGSSGTATGSASIATAVCVFIIHLAATNTNAISVSPKTPTCMRCAASRSQLVANGLDNSNGSPSQKAYNSPSGSSHSSPSSLYGLSPPTPPCSTAYEVSTHSLSSGAIDSLTFGNRSRILLQNQKHNSTANGSFNVLDGTTFTSPFSSNQANSVCCNSTGGGFASLAPHTGKLLAALLSALPGACRHPNSSGKVIQEEMAKTLAILLRFAKDTSVIKLFNRVRSWYLQPEQSTASSDGGVHDGSSISISHWACVRVLHAVAHHCPDLLYAHAGITLPLVFLSKQVEGEVESLICSRESSSPIFHSRNRGVNINFLRHEANINVSTNNNGSISAKMNSTDVEIYQQLWQECWEELISRITSAPCSPHSVLFWPNSVTLGLKSVLPLANGLANSFLRRPLLDHSTKLLYDALLESPSWSVRNQASFAILQLAYRMLGQPFSTSNTSVGKRNRCSGRPLTKVVHETSPVAVINPGSVKISQESLKSDDRENPNVKCTSVEVSGDEAEIQEILEQQILNLEENEILNDDNDGFSDDVGEDDDIMVENETSSGHAWLILVQLTATALSKCTPWPGKIYLLRATRALAEFAFEQRSIIEEPVNQDVIRQMWCTLLRETQPKSAEGVKAGYQAEAFLTFASFAEACGRDAIAVNHPHSVVNNDPDGSFSMKPPVDCLSNLFVLIIPQWLKRWKNSAQNKNIENLKLNTKLNDLELEYAVRAVGIMWPINSTKEHSCFLLFNIFLSFINLCKDSTRQLLQSFSNDSIQALRDWAAELLGSL
ncbi:Proteasome adapter and scaffold protein ECM29 [Schistosoma japonicum]|nr:Proteasome adapter and scaffold protein ECM29 [Schistosoma japonicum]